MRYEILNKKSEVINSIVADADFMSTAYPPINGVEQYRLSQAQGVEITPPETEIEKLIKTLVLKGVLTDADSAKIKEVK